MKAVVNVQKGVQTALDHEFIYYELLIITMAFIIIINRLASLVCILTVVKKRNSAWPTGFYVGKGRFRSDIHGTHRRCLKVDFNC